MLAAKAAFSLGLRRGYSLNEETIPMLLSSGTVPVMAEAW